MGRKVGKKRSKCLNDALNAVIYTTNWNTPYEAFGLTKHQWNNFNKYAEWKLWKMAVEAKRLADSVKVKK